MSFKTSTTQVGPFNLSTPAGTDIWRKPPSHNVLTAPTHPSPLPKYELRKFQRARLQFWLPPADTLRQYDQAGLLLHFTNSSLKEGQDKWLKTGIEWYYGKPYVSTVGCDAWADWSIVPLSPALEGPKSRPGVVIEARREKDPLGKSLWIYQLTIGEDGEVKDRFPLREVNWVFAEEEGWEIGVGGFVARPTVEGGEAELEAEFPVGVEVEFLDG